LRLKIGTRELVPPYNQLAVALPPQPLQRVHESNGLPNRAVD